MAEYCHDRATRRTISLELAAVALAQWVLAGILTGLTLEAGQALGNWLLGLGRWVDVNDVLTNATGIVIGAILFWCWRQWQQKMKGRGSKCL